MKKQLVIASLLLAFCCSCNREDQVNESDTPVAETEEMLESVEETLPETTEEETKDPLEGIEVKKEVSEEGDVLVVTSEEDGEFRIPCSFDEIEEVVCNSTQNYCAVVLSEGGVDSHLVIVYLTDHSWMEYAYEINTREMLEQMVKNASVAVSTLEDGKNQLTIRSAEEETNYILATNCADWSEQNLRWKGITVDAEEFVFYVEMELVGTDGEVIANLKNVVTPVWKWNAIHASNLYREKYGNRWLVHESFNAEIEFLQEELVEHVEREALLKQCWFGDAYYERMRNEKEYLTLSFATEKMLEEAWDYTALGAPQDPDATQLMKIIDNENYRVYTVQTNTKAHYILTECEDTYGTNPQMDYYVAPLADQVNEENESTHFDVNLGVYEVGEEYFYFLSEQDGELERKWFDLGMDARPRYCEAFQDESVDVTTSRELSEYWELDNAYPFTYKKYSEMIMNIDVIKEYTWLLNESEDGRIQMYCRAGHPLGLYSGTFAFCLEGEWIQAKTKILFMIDTNLYEDPGNGGWCFNLKEGNYDHSRTLMQWFSVWKDAAGNIHVEAVT